GQSGRWRISFSSLPPCVQFYMFRVSKIWGAFQRKGKELWIYTFGIPFKGRVLPIQTELYAPEPLTRNETHQNLIEGLIEKVGKDLVIVFDAELTYEAILKELKEEGISYVVPLKREVTLIDPETGERYSLRELKEKVYQGGVSKWSKELLYKGEGRVKVVVHKFPFPTGRGERVGILIASLDLEDEEVISAYRERMKIEETFRDWKSYNGVEKLMFRKREILEKLLLVLMVAYTLFTLFGEMLKEKVVLNPLERRKKSGYFLVKFEFAF
ncbi:MAG: transposase, partial [Desulfurobacteriaceae bacterium]